MSKHPSVRLTLFLLLMLLLGVPAPAWPGAKEDVAATTAKWGELFAIDEPAVIAALYDKEAVLWGTLSPKVRNTPELIHEYFVGAYKALPGHKVSFGEQLIRVGAEHAEGIGGVSADRIVEPGL